MTREIKHHITLNAAPEAVFEALMDQRQHRQFTGEPAKIRAANPAAHFIAMAITLRRYQCRHRSTGLIIQSWRPATGRRPGIIPSSPLKLARLSGCGRTRLAFTQLGVPASDYVPKKIKAGAIYYWELLKKYLATKM